MRVWGGGIYQPSDELTGGYDFYSVCDELGLLAWSELTFSDNSYPTNAFLLDNIEPEVRQNIRRVNRHPSNAQWAGANELEIIVLLIDESWNNATSKQFMTDVRVFLRISSRRASNSSTAASVPIPLRRVLARHCSPGAELGKSDLTISSEIDTHSNQVAYTDSSFTFGVLSLDPYEIRYRNQTPGFIYGNFGAGNSYFKRYEEADTMTERYNYDASQAFNYSTYPVTRFVSEFGSVTSPAVLCCFQADRPPPDSTLSPLSTLGKKYSRTPKTFHSTPPWWPPAITIRPPEVSLSRIQMCTKDRLR